MTRPPRAEAGPLPLLPEPAGDRPPLKRRLAGLILVAGAVAAAASMLPHWPKERTAVLRLERPEDVIGLDVTWLARRTDDAEGAPALGASWSFAPGAAPRSLSASVRLPDGLYDVQITVRRRTGSESVHRSLTLGDGDEITLPVP